MDRYQEGFEAGRASVRQSPLIVVDWSTLPGFMLNLLGFIVLFYGALWFGELRGMKNDNRLSIVIDGVEKSAEKVGAATDRADKAVSDGLAKVETQLDGLIAGEAKTADVLKRWGSGMTIRVKGENQ